MSSFPHTRRAATLARSLRLLFSFPQEQRDPENFYRNLAEDTATQLENLRRDCVGTSLKGSSILDVGGGPGYFADAFNQRGASYTAVEPDASELSAAGLYPPRQIRASGHALPFKDEAFDLSFSSNVVEHVPRPWAMGEEMLRVTRRGGLVVLSYTIWLGPFGGHETGLWPHYLGGEFARKRYERIHGRPPKNIFGQSLFAVSCAEGMRWAKEVATHGQAELEILFPRYHPSWAWWLVKIPVVREFLVSNLVIVLRKP